MRLKALNSSIANLEVKSAKAKLDSCNFFEIIIVILTFVAEKMTVKGRVSLPSAFNIIKWFMIGKFLFDVVKVIVNCLNGKQTNKSELHKPLLAIADKRGKTCCTKLSIV